MNKCPWFDKCGGCKFDFTATDYKNNKEKLIEQIPITDSPIWLNAGIRRRADFAFAGGKFGLFEKGTKNIIQIENCPNLTQAINNILPEVAKLPWRATGSCLITECENGIDIAISANVPYVSPDFRNATHKLPAIRITWNDKVVKQTEKPMIAFGKNTVEYPPNAFLQPSVEGADTMRKMVCENTSGCKHIADLFCGLGNFTFETNAIGFDVVGTGIKRDLFKKPLSVGTLNQYDCVIMDPPRAGALAQSKEIANSNVKRVIYISCNPETFMRDKKVLESGGYKNTTIIPIDQFVGSTHWELFSIFEK
jgi:23S rRNA (uracil1939-C5)-methyltransferase